MVDTTTVTATGGDTFSQIIGYVIVIGVIIFFVAIMYRALKDPIDLFLGKMKQLFVWIFGKVGSAGTSTVTTIKYE